MVGSITSAGIGSGLDVESIITQLMALERRPLDQISVQQTELDFKASALGQLKSSVSRLQEAVNVLAKADGFSAVSAKSSNEDAFSASASGGVPASQHSVNVVELAQQHRLSSNAFTGSTAAVGTGVLNLSAGGSGFEVNIDASNNSLAGIRDAINDEPGNTGITASIVNADDGSRLILTANNSGTAALIEVAATTDDAGGGLSALNYQAAGDRNLTEVGVARDAVVEVDGFSVTSNSNTVVDVIDGITFELKAPGSGSVSVERDDTSGTGALEAFVSAYNTFSAELTGLRAGELAGTNLLLEIETQLRDLFSSPTSNTPGVTSYLFEVGLSFDRDGILSLDKSKLEQRFTSDFDNVVRLFSDPDSGFAGRVDRLLDNYVQSGGAIDARTNGLQSQRRLLGGQVERFEFRLEVTEERLRSQFASLDSLVGTLQSTSGFLTQQLSNLPFNNL